MSTRGREKKPRKRVRPRKIYCSGAVATPVTEPGLDREIPTTHPAALDDELLPYVHAANQDFTPYLARARNHTEAIDNAFRFRLAFLRRLNEVKCVHGDQGVLNVLQAQHFQLAAEHLGSAIFGDLMKDYERRVFEATVASSAKATATARMAAAAAGRGRGGGRGRAGEHGLSQFTEFFPDSENISPREATTATVVRRSLGGLNTCSWRSRARFYLRVLHDVVGSKWGGRLVRMTHQLRRDLQWWTAVPTQSNGCPIHRPMETAYVHCDSSGFGWGAVLNGRLEAREFRGAADERRHITLKEMKAVQLAVEPFLPHLAGRRVLLHEDNQAVCNVLVGLTSRSPEMMEEHPPPGFYLCGRHTLSAKARPLRRTSSTCVVVLQKIKHIGGWAELSSFVLDYINPTALPCAASWHRFGWLIPYYGVGR
eukprot:jgi/Tetstr1/431707/TSEL_021232.t1